jgi:hypothetical protein
MTSTQWIKIDIGVYKSGNYFRTHSSDGKWFSSPDLEQVQIVREQYLLAHPPKINELASLEDINMNSSVLRTMTNEKKLYLSKIIAELRVIRFEKDYRAVASAKPESFPEFLEVKENET